MAETKEELKEVLKQHKKIKQKNKDNEQKIYKSLINAVHKKQTCIKCKEQITVTINGMCNTCLSKEDELDEIQYPKHYNAGKIQPIDVIESWQLDFRLANAVKYIARHKHKGSAKKDLEKAVWYIERYISKELSENIK